LGFNATIFNKCILAIFNNYFVFKKIREVNIPNVFNVEVSKTVKITEGNTEMKSRDMIKQIMAERIQKVFIKYIWNIDFSYFFKYKIII
jgi:hypothetical protein